MKAVSVYIESMPLLRITRCEITKNINTHLKAEIEGHIETKEGKNPDDYLLEETINILVTVGDTCESSSIFRGIITSLSVSTDNNFVELGIIAESYTKLMDIECHFRCFQNIRMTYKEIAKHIIGCQDNAISIMNRETDAPINELLVQYKETDWEFLKRLASGLNTVLVADCTNEKASFYFGMAERTNINDISLLSVQRRLIAEEGRKIHEVLAHSRDILNLQDKVMVMGIPLYVYGIRMSLQNGELVNLYILRHIKNFNVRKYDNPNLAGISVVGHVEKVKHTQVQITLDHDSFNAKNDKLWFDFATVYSSSDGSGWYCMPELGDEVRLYFPDGFEKNAYVISSVHSERTNGLRTKPDEKFIRTIYDKEIRFTPTKIILTNHKGMKIVLDDEKGIEIISNKDVQIRSGAEISIESGDGIEIEAESGVYLRQKRNVLMVRDGILEHGLNIEHR